MTRPPLRPLKILTILTLTHCCSIALSEAAIDVAPEPGPSEPNKVRLLATKPPTEATGSLTFDGQLFRYGWGAEAGGSKLKEYYLPGEGPQNWTKMLTLQFHPTAKTVAAVTQPYLASRAPFISMAPKTFNKPQTVQTVPPTDTVLQLGLGAPRLTPHFEFVTARFSACPEGVIGIIFCYRTPFTGSDPHQKIDLSEPKKKNPLWRAELFKIPTPQLIEEFLPGTHLSN